MKTTPHIVLGVSGSIAAYKAAELVRLMRKEEWEIAVMMTSSATKYVGPLTFQALTGRPVASGRFDEGDAGIYQHIDLADWGDVLVLAPCTANLMAKVACGLADDVVTATVLASRKPLLIAPAMNAGMWENRATRANVETLKSRGVVFADVGSGQLACGHVGPGRLMEPMELLGHIRRLLPGASH